MCLDFSYKCTPWSIFGPRLCIKFANTLFTHICREFKKFKVFATKILLSWKFLLFLTLILSQVLSLILYLILSQVVSMECKDTSALLWCCLSTRHSVSCPVFDVDPVLVNRGWTLIRLSEHHCTHFSTPAACFEYKWTLSGRPGPSLV